MIRVIGGEFRGRALASVPGESTRPPLAKVRGAVANILAEYIADARVVDMFSGTGSYSIELLSRGAAHATCIDKNPKAIEVIRRNFESLGIGTNLGVDAARTSVGKTHGVLEAGQPRARLIIGDAIRVIKILEKTAAPFDILLVAPPYFTGLDKQAMDILGISPLINPAGIVVLQQHRKEAREDTYGQLTLNRTYMYGDTRISTYLIAREPLSAYDNGKTVRAVTE